MRKKRIIIDRTGFGCTTMKRQHKYWMFWITLEWSRISLSYRYFDKEVEEGKQKGYEIIYKDN